MDTNQIIEQLFADAKAKNFVEYVFTLLRVGPIESYEKDPLLEFEEKILSRKADKAYIDSASAFWALVTNLPRVSEGHCYNPYIFFNSRSDNYKEEAESNVRQDLAVLLEAEENRFDFITQFLSKYRAEVKSFANSQKLFKLPRFEVLELLTNEEKGLFGFKMYFSNGSHAEYVREDKGTSAVNLILDDSGVGFMVGDLDKLKATPEWRIRDKRLYEIGLPGRYNEPGEWKPIVYPGESGNLQNEAVKASEDERIQGVLFYMLCTGYRIIEFAAKMVIKLPDKRTILPGDVNLLLVERETGEVPDFSNEYVYDGWLELKDGLIETIKEGLDAIQRAMQGLSFSFDNQVKWNLKYMIAGHQHGAAAPEAKDAKYMEQIIRKTQERKDLVIDTAMNWYQLGLLTQNPLNAFLCFHIAIEGLAIKLSSGKLHASKLFGFEKEKKEDRKKRIADCFDKYYKQYATINLEKMIQEAYFNCIYPIKFHLKRAFEGVFGKNHKVIKEYFDGKESIWAIRGKLAHGEYSDWHYDEYIKAWNKLWLVREIAKSFISRVILEIPPGKKKPDWSRLHHFSIGMDSPKGALVVSRLDILPRKEWRIKPEWID